MSLKSIALRDFVIVRELAAGDWGYGGQTQLARQLRRQAVPAQAK